MAAFAAEHRDQSSFSIQIYCDSLLELDVCIVFKLHLIITREILYYYANKLKFMNKIFQLMARSPYCCTQPRKPWDAAH